MNAPERIEYPSSSHGTYDYLFDDSYEMPEMPEREPTPELTDRQKEIFAPLELVETNNNTSYDYLFDPNGDTESYSVENAAIRDENDRRPTEESILAATAEVNDPTLDARIRSIIRNHTSPEMSPREIVEFIQIDAATRYDLAEYLLDKVGRLAHKMPQRVSLDKPKDPNHLGYPKDIRSREYAAVLALSMLDGSFKQESVGRGDDITYTQETREKVVLGQHRAAANLLLHED